MGAICLLSIFFPLLIFRIFDPPPIGFRLPLSPFFCLLVGCVCVLISIENDLLTSNQKRKTDNATTTRCCVFVCYETVVGFSLIFVFGWVSKNLNNKRLCVRGPACFFLFSPRLRVRLFSVSINLFARVKVRFLSLIVCADCLPPISIASKIVSRSNMYNNTNGDEMYPPSSGVSTGYPPVFQ